MCVRNRIGVLAAAATRSSFTISTLHGVGNFFTHFFTHLLMGLMIRAHTHAFECQHFYLFGCSYWKKRFGTMRERAFKSQLQKTNSENKQSLTPNEMPIKRARHPPPKYPNNKDKKVKHAPFVACFVENILITERARERVHGQAHAFRCFGFFFPPVLFFSLFFYAYTKSKQICRIDY